MRRRFSTMLFIATILLIGGCVSTNRVVENGPLNPLSFGLTQARTGKDRYKVLLATHQEAIRRGVGVSYKGIESIDLEIPQDIKSIPLPDYTDFAGVTINVVNNYKSMVLFTLSATGRPIAISASDIDNGFFTNVPELSKGCYLLSVNDKKPWVDKRIGYDYSHIRRDVFFIKDGKSDGPPIMPYNNVNSSPECSFVPVSGRQKVIKNLHIIRSNKSTQITKVFKISFQDKVLISDLVIETDNPRELFADGAISISNCTDITLENIYARGSYSRKNKYGYVFELNNLANLCVRNVDAFANWGVFGNNNLRQVSLEGCKLNRFDIHCYGRDVTCKNCVFSNLYNQFSSTYGHIIFDHCRFTSFTPYLNAGSYNAFVPVDIEFKECEFNLDSKHNSIVGLTGISDEENSRPELAEKCLPNVSIIGCTVNIEDGMKNWYIINPGTVGYKKSMGHISEIKIERTVSNAPEKAMKVFSREVKTRNAIKVKTRNMRFVGNE